MVPSVLREALKRSPAAVRASFITHLDGGNTLSRCIDSLLMH